MRSILQLLGLDGAAPDTGRDTAAVRRIAEELHRLEPDRARYVAAFAYILARVARADLQFQDEELRSMERIVAEFAGLPEPQAVLVVEIARSQAIQLGGTEDYLVTRQFKAVSDRAGRIELIRCLFAVGASDGSISHLEDQTIAQIGRELGLTAAEIAACRSSYRDHLAVLQNLPTRAPESS